MEFKFNSETRIVESDEPDTYMECLWQMPESGIDFLLVWRGMRIGFRTADVTEDDKTERMSDGTQIWRFDNVFCKIARPDRSRGGVKVLTDTYALGAKESVLEALDLFRDSLIVFNAGLQLKPEEPPPARVEFSKRVHQQIEAGKFVSD